jgi:hypothetical protein
VGEGELDAGGQGAHLRQSLVVSECNAALLNSVCVQNAATAALIGGEWPRPGEMHVLRHGLCHAAPEGSAAEGVHKGLLRHGAQHASGPWHSRAGSPLGSHKKGVLTLVGAGMPHSLAEAAASVPWPLLHRLSGPRRVHRVPYCARAGPCWNMPAICDAGMFKLLDFPLQEMKLVVFSWPYYPQVSERCRPCKQPRAPGRCGGKKGRKEMRLSSAVLWSSTRICCRGVHTSTFPGGRGS